MREDKVKYKPKKTVVEPDLKDKDWESVIQYIKWWEKLDPALQKFATHYDKIRKVRYGMWN